MSCGTSARPRHFARFFQHHGHPGFGPGEKEFMGHEGFGVRRPLRFLAHRLELNESQVVELARILDALKIERAQTEVDDRRALSDFADAIAGEAFDVAKASTAGDRRVKQRTALRETLIKSLQAIHAILTPEQRARMAHLVRTGILSM